MTDEELYDKGFEDQEIVSQEIEEEEVEQPEEEVEEEAEEVVDEQEETEPTETEEEDSIEEVEEDVEEEPFIEVERHGVKIKMNKEEAQRFSSLGFDYTAKTQDLSDKRNILELVGDKTAEEVKAMIDAFNGDSNAMAYLAKKNNIDPYDIDTDSSYAPKVEEVNYGLKDVIEVIKADTENAKVIDELISSLPQSVHSMFSQDPKILSDLHQEVKDGNAQKIMPEVMKAMAMNPMVDFRQAYQAERSKVLTKSKEEVPREVKKKATIVKKKPAKKIDHTDIWDDDDLYNEYHALLKKNR